VFVQGVTKERHQQANQEQRLLWVGEKNLGVDAPSGNKNIHYQTNAHLAGCRNGGQIGENQLRVKRKKKKEESLPNWDNPERKK